MNKAFKKYKKLPYTETRYWWNRNYSMYVDLLKMAAQVVVTQPHINRGKE